MGVEATTANRDVSTAVDSRNPRKATTSSVECGSLEPPRRSRR